MNCYTIKRSLHSLPPAGDWGSPEWNAIEPLSISNFLQGSSDHRPVTLVKAVHDNKSIHILFKVHDRYVRATRTGYMTDVWNDSCVEWFAQPVEGKGYFNFEINCVGALYASYVEDPARIGGVLKKFTCLPMEIGSKIRIHHSLSPVVDPEIPGPIDWTIGLAVPLAVFEPYVGPIVGLSRRRWRANFSKCGDQTSHPSWAGWSHLTERNFHRPWEFGEIVFE